MAEPSGASTSNSAASVAVKLVLLVVGAVLAAFGTYIWDEYIKPKPLFVNIQVFDDSTPRNYLKDVAVWLKLSDVDPKRTGDFGLVRFQIPRNHRKEVVAPTLDLKGYSQVKGRDTDRIVLDRGETNVIFVMRKDTAPIVLPDQAFSGSPPILERKTYSSGSQASGPGSSFSRWYELCNDPAPPGWVVSESSFVLTGDRQCNAWSECKQTESQPTRTCWQFRMQGHSEQLGLFGGGNTGIQFSTGILSVVWKH